MPGVRGRNEGSLFERKRDGRWVAMVTMPDGKRRSASAASKDEGVAALRKLIKQRDEGVPDPTGLRVGTYLRRWIGSVSGKRLAPATIRQHEMIVRVHLVPAFGHRHLTQLTPSDVDAYLDALTLDPQTKRHHRSTLRRALADAVRDGLVSRNVAALSTAPRMQKAERTYLTVAQVRHVIEAGRDERQWPLFVLIATTGLRVSEALGLAWSDVAGDSLTVRYQLARVGGEWVRAIPKTRRSRRTIPLTPQAIAALAEQRIRQDAERGDHPRPIDGLMFTTPTGAPIHSTNLLPPWRALLARLGLPRVTIHDLRHAAASMMFEVGIPIEVIADLLGHSTVRVTQDLYVHRRPEMQHKAIALLAEALG